MRPIELLKAAGVGIAVLVLTLLLSVPLVAFYAYFIEPGHPQDFYNEAALWIAPWSSHIFGPLLFMAFNYLYVRKHARHAALRFALATIVCYAVIDAGSLPLFGVEVGSFLTLTVLISLMARTVGAFAGAWIGTRPSATLSPPEVART